MNRKKLHLIGNSHLDPVWLWHWQEGLQEMKAVFRSALDRMNENPDFFFTCSSTIFFEWVEENNPAMFEEIKRRVSEGRLEIVGGWVVQPDCNIPAGESFVRHGLYGQRYFLSRFGKKAVTGYNVDSFGHAGSLPQILRKFGLKNYVFMRPFPEAAGDLPGRCFLWEAADGSQILTYQIPYTYNTGGDALDALVERIDGEFSGDVEELMFFYGVGNHGGGPTKENIRSLRELGKKPELPEMVFSTTEAFFEGIRGSGKSPAVYRKDLQHFAVGCYTAVSRVKRLNRLAENNLLAAEKLCSITRFVEGRSYPADFERAWKSVLFNQFHDILAGTAIPSAYEDTCCAFGEAITIAQRNLNGGLQSMTWDIGIEQDETMKPIVVMNPHAWAGKMVVEVEVSGLRDAPFRLTDAEGNPVRAQLVQSESVTKFRWRLLFVADLPSMGYAVYKLYAMQETGDDFSDVRADCDTLENDWYKLRINPATGFVGSLFDKKNGVEVFGGDAARLAVMEDKSDTWGNSGDRFDRYIGAMRPVGVRLVERGPVRATLQVKYRYQDSLAVQYIRLYEELPYVEVHTDLDWREPHTCLKLQFPVNVENGGATCEIPYGTIARGTDGHEEPGQSWCDLSGAHAGNGAAYGVSVANDCKYGYSFNGREMSVTLLRNPVYANLEYPRLSPETDYPHTDDGPQSLTYAILPHAGSWKDSAITRLAAEINTRPIVLLETYHKGRLPQRQSFVENSSPQVMVTVLKEAEDGDGLILRAYETLGRDADTVMTLSFLNSTFHLHFTPNEIKTVKIPYAAPQTCVEVNMLEWEEDAAETCKEGL